LILKRGIAPFHFWFPNVIEGLNWTNNFILITWQKIAPLIILSFCLNFFLFLIAIIFSSFIGAINGLNQTSLRKLIAYSSINHLSWIISGILNNEHIWKVYFLFYSFLSFLIIFLFKRLKIFNLNQVFSISLKNNFIKLFVSLPLLSLGGLPPFLGFFPKWIIIEILIFSKFYWLVIVLINFSLITLYFYIRICYSAFFLNFNKINFFSINFFTLKNKKSYFFINFISLFGLLFINLFFF
jgi:NADH-ubiquinone oxidoreductase chain 2